MIVSFRKEKNMKNKKILALLLSLVMLFCLVSCGEAKNSETGEAPVKGEQTVEEQVNVEIFLMMQNGDKQIHPCGVPAGKSVKMIDLINENPDWGFSWSGDYFVERFNGAEPDSSKNEYIAIYTTDKAQSTGESVEIEGIEFYYAALGITGLELKDGQSYLFRVENF